MRCMTTFSFFERGSYTLLAFKSSLSVALTTFLKLDRELVSPKFIKIKDFFKMSDLLSCYPEFLWFFICIQSISEAVGGIQPYLVLFRCISAYTAKYFTIKFILIPAMYLQKLVVSDGIDIWLFGAAFGYIRLSSSVLFVNKVKFAMFFQYLAIFCKKTLL